MQLTLSLEKYDEKVEMLKAAVAQSENLTTVKVKNIERKNLMGTLIIALHVQFFIFVRRKLSKI